jgi:hypothetical protein
VERLSTLFEGVCSCSTSSLMSPRQVTCIEGLNLGTCTSKSGFFCFRSESKYVLRRQFFLSAHQQPSPLRNVSLYNLSPLSSAAASGPSSLVCIRRTQPRTPLCRKFNVADDRAGGLAALAVSGLRKSYGRIGQ